MKKWEYIAINSQLSEERLNELGSKGWELVTHTAIINPLKGSGSQYYIFKRPK